MEFNVPFVCTSMSRAKLFSNVLIEGLGTLFGWWHISQTGQNCQNGHAQNQYFFLDIYKKMYLACYELTNYIHNDTILPFVPCIVKVWTNHLDFYTLRDYYSHKMSHILCSSLCKCMFLYSCMMLGIYMEEVNRLAYRVLAVSLVISQHPLPHTHTGLDLV